MISERLEEAAHAIRQAVKRVENLPTHRQSRVYAGPEVIALRALGFDRRDVALAVACWLDEVAESWRLSGDAENWQNAVDVADLILASVTTRA